MSAHEKLQVYGKALDFVAKTAVWTNSWDRRHAFVDHLSRAAESIALNLAEAARQRGAPGRLQILDFAVGSSLECAGCFDIAQIKQLLTAHQCYDEKLRLCEITKMLIGLRKAWAESTIEEESSPFTSGSAESESDALFHHEKLQVYQTSLAFMEWFVARPQTKGLPNRLFRELDEAATSVVLNIAEGNGRYAELDQHRFLQIAQRAAVKAMVYVDVCVERALIPEREVTAGKELLRNIGAMVAGF